MKASCLCGAVAWETDEPQFMSHCHCSRCRKAHGTAFATFVMQPEAGFRWLRNDTVVRWESAPGWYRSFCGRCGSVVPGDPADGNMFVPAGPMDDDPQVRPLAHIFTASKAPWYEIRDSLPQFDAYPPGVDGPVMSDRPPLDPPGKTRGSCLCGGVAFVAEGQPIRVTNCHCGRCRKARSAAHASNLILPSAGVSFTRGEDLLRSYKVPEARFFTQIFCATCGSPVPRIDPSRGFAVIPMGALDDDPGFRLQHHIFVGSKAPWFDIADDLPQHQEAPPTT